jgi:hypothetical protein
MINTWLAIHWLSILYSTRESHAFGLREIAQEAGVGRNELSGAKGYIQRLVDLRLIQIVGHRQVAPNLKPCPVYQIDMVELERQSLQACQGLLRERSLPAPPRPVPDPRQLALFDLDLADVSRPEAHPNGTGATAPNAARPEFGHSPALNGDRAPAERASLSRFRDRGTDEPTTHGTASETGISAHSQLQGRPETRDLLGSCPVSGTEPHETGTEPHETGTDNARNRDIEGKKEGKKERETAPTPNSLLALATAAAHAALLELFQSRAHTLNDELGASALLPTPPAGELPLPAPVLTLWGADRAQILQRDRFQLEQLAATADRATAGHGAYWLGRSIIMAEACLEPRGQRPTVAYLRALLRRWERENSWGSDLEDDEPPTPTARPASKAAPAPAPDDMAHPAVVAYTAALREAPNAVQAAQIAATVADLDAWRQVLTEWQLNGWAERSVGKMLDRYLKTLPAGAVTPEPPPSVAAIHVYPGLTPEQRDRWIRKFHNAATPAEKRAVIRRLEQEHPQ